MRFSYIFSLILLFVQTNIVIAQHDEEKVYVNVYKGLGDNFDVDLQKARAVDFVSGVYEDFGYPDKITDLKHNLNTDLEQRCDYGIHELYGKYRSFNFFNFSVFDLLGQDFLNVGSNSFRDICGNNGQKCLCEESTTCERNHTLNKLDPSKDYSERAPNICLFKEDCRGSDLSQKGYCQSVLNPNDHDKCEGLDDTKCFYRGKCLSVPLSKEYVLAGEDETTDSELIKCENHYNCSSGYCRDLTSDQAKAIFNRNLGRGKYCMPVAECAPACKEVSDVPFNVGEGYCCEGAYSHQVGNQIYCLDPTDIFVLPGPEIEVVFNDDDCSGGLKLLKQGLPKYPDLDLEENNQVVEAISAKYNRKLLGLEFLWSNSDVEQNPARNDWFGTNQRLQDISNSYSSLRLGHDYSMLLAMYKLKLSSDNDEDLAAGVSSLTKLSEYYLELSSIFLGRSNMFKSLIGYDQNSIQDFFNVQKNDLSDDHYNSPSKDGYDNSGSFTNHNSLVGVMGANRTPRKIKIEEKNEHLLELSDIFHKYRGGGYRKMRRGSKHFDINSFSDFFERFVCKNGKGGYIHAAYKNFRCVREMIKIKNDDQTVNELVDPIYPSFKNQSFFDGAVDSESDDYVSYNKSKFPNAKRLIIGESALKNNIKASWKSYADEVIENNRCLEQRKSLDFVSDSELQIITGLINQFLSVLPGARTLSKEDVIKIFIETYGEGVDSDGIDIWRKSLANDIIANSTFDSLKAIYQKAFIPGGIGKLSSLNLNNPSVLWSGFMQFSIIYDRGDLVDFQNPFKGFNLSRDAWFHDWLRSVLENYYMNATSYRDNLGVPGITELMYGGAWLENYSLAKAAFYEQTGSCLRDKAIEFSNAYKELDGDNEDSGSFNIQNNEMLTSLSTAANYMDVKLNCADDGSGSSGGGGGGSNSLGSLDSSLDDNSHSTVTQDSGMKKIETGTGENVISSFKNLSSGNTSGGVNVKNPKLKDNAKVSGSLMNTLKGRNSALAAISKKNEKRLKKLGLNGNKTEAMSKSQVASLALQGYSGVPAIKKLLSGKVQPASNVDVKTGTKTTNNAVKASKKREGSLKKKSSEKSSSRRKSNSSSYRSYKSSSKSKDKIPVEDLKRMMKSVKRDESDSLWDNISNTYKEKGIPRLFDLKSK